MPSITTSVLEPLIVTLNGKLNLLLHLFFGFEKRQNAQPYSLGFLKNDPSHLIAVSAVGAPPSGGVTERP